MTKGRRTRLVVIAVCLLLGAVANAAVTWWRAATAEFHKQASFFVADRSGASSVPFFVLVHRRSGVGLDQVAYPPTDAMEWQRAGLEVQDSRPGLPRWAVWPREPVDKTVLYVAAGWPLKAVVCHRVGEHRRRERHPGTRCATGLLQRSALRGATAYGAARMTVPLPARMTVPLPRRPDRTESGWRLPLVYYQQSALIDPAISVSWRSLSRVLPLRPLPLGIAINTLFYAAILWLLMCGPFVLRRFWRVEQGFCPKCRYPIGKSSVCTECACGLPKRAVAS